MKSILKEIQKIREELVVDIKSNLAVNRLKIKYLGRKSKFNFLLKNLKNFNQEEKKIFGQKANQLKKYIQSIIVNYENQNRKTDQFIDLTLPSANNPLGSIHPIRAMQLELVEIFSQLGFEIAFGPEIESSWYNFEALNIDENHPARDDQDSFYIDDTHLLRTQTSSVQLRVLEKSKPPIRIISPGRIFRRDSADATHTPTFHQIEGLIVDENVTFADLKGILNYAVKKIFLSSTETRFRVSYFPFVEPGAEMDISCPFCSNEQKFCQVCKNSGWIEILGCGMVHPKVLKNAKIDPKKYRGIAFGMGIERPFMIKHQIPTIKLFYENNLSFLNQFR